MIININSCSYAVCRSRHEVLVVGLNLSQALLVLIMSGFIVRASSSKLARRLETIARCDLTVNITVNGTRSTKRKSIQQYAWHSVPANCPRSNSRAYNASENTLVPARVNYRFFDASK